MQKIYQKSRREVDSAYEKIDDVRDSFAAAFEKVENAEKALNLAKTEVENAQKAFQQAKEERSAAYHKNNAVRSKHAAAETWHKKVQKRLYIAVKTVAEEVINDMGRIERQLLYSFSQS